MFQDQSRFLLSRIPITPWVLGTVEKMNKAGAITKSTWNDNWLQTYRALGGESEESGGKPCPKAAAYGLWFFGHLREGGRARLDFWTEDRENQQFGKNKNAAYAVIAADLLAQGASVLPSELSPIVRSEYARRTGHTPANSEQGEIRLVIALFCEREIVFE